MRNLLGLMAVCVLLIFGTFALNAQTYDYTRTVDNVDPGNPQYGNPAYVVPDVTQVASAQVPAGSQLAIRTNEKINAPKEDARHTYSGEVTQNVLGPNGEVLIPKGSPVELTIGAHRSH